MYKPRNIQTFNRIASIVEQIFTRIEMECTQFSFSIRISSIISDSFSRSSETLDLKLLAVSLCYHLRFTGKSVGWRLAFWSRTNQIYTN